MPTLPSNWPHSGKIEFSNVILRYLENEAPALNNISFTIAPQSHVAIVGRTGSGKSSIFACLLRKYLIFNDVWSERVVWSVRQTVCIILGLVNEVLGEVRIDNVNIFGVDVLNVRRAISTISQDSLLFCGTVRQNLDPAEEYPDHVLTKIIDTVDLTEKVSQLGGLDGQIEARGANFSKERL